MPTKQLILSPQAKKSLQQCVRKWKKNKSSKTITKKPKKSAAPRRRPARSECKRAAPPTASAMKSRSGGGRPKALLRGFGGKKRTFTFDENA